MFSKIKESFVSIYETMKRKIIGAYVRCKNWLVDTLTGEVMSDLGNMDVNPAVWDAVRNVMYDSCFIETIKWAAFRTIIGNRNYVAPIHKMIGSAVLKLVGISIGAYLTSLLFTISSIPLYICCYYAVEFLGLVSLVTLFSNGK